MNGRNNKTKQSTIFSEPKESDLNYEEKLSTQENKSQRLANKKSHKFELHTQAAIDFIVKGEIRTAISQLVELIDQQPFLDRYSFEGWGMRENYIHSFPGQPLAWFTFVQQEGAQIRNVFDLLGICFMLLMVEFQIKPQQIHSYYQSLQLKTKYKDEVSVLIANTFYNCGQYEIAQSHYLEVLKTRPLEKVYEYMAWIRQKQDEKYFQALKYAELCLEMNSRNIGALIVQNKFETNFQSHLRNLLIIMDIEPHCFRVALELAELQVNIQSKLKWINKAIYIQPNVIECYLIKAQLLIDINTKQCREALQKALKLYPNHFEVYYLMGELQKEEMHQEEAIRNYKKSISLNPMFFKATKALGDTYRPINLQMCIKVYEDFIRKDPQNGEAYHQLAQAYYLLGQKDQTFRFFNKAIEVNPYLLQSLVELAELYLSQRSFQEACSLYKRAYEIVPQADYCYGIALSYFGLYLPYEAKKWAIECVERGGDDEYKVCSLLGDIYTYCGCYDLAVKWYLKQVCSCGLCEVDKIETKIISKIGKDKTAAIILRLLETSGQFKDNIYLFVCLGKFFMKLNYVDETARCFEIAKQLVLGLNFPSNIKRQIEKFYGNRELGIYPYVDKFKMEELKQEFSQIFQNTYKTGDQ